MCVKILEVTAVIVQCHWQLLNLTSNSKSIVAFFSASRMTVALVVQNKIVQNDFVKLKSPAQNKIVKRTFPVQKTIIKNFLRRIRLIEERFLHRILWLKKKSFLYKIKLSKNVSCTEYDC